MGIPDERRRFCPLISGERSGLTAQPVIHGLHRRIRCFRKNMNCALQQKHRPYPLRAGHSAAGKAVPHCIRLFYQNFFFLQIHRLSTTMAALTAMMAG